jgi:hypothetical protein
MIKLPLASSRQPYLWIATMGMKRDTLFEDKEVTSTCEEVWETTMNTENC